MFSENDIEDDNKKIIDDILKDINYSDILMKCKSLEKDIKSGQKTRETLNFKDILLPKTKKEINISYFLQVKQSVKNIKKLDKRKMTD